MRNHSVGDQPEHHPSNLTRSQFDRLSVCANEAETIPTQDLLAAARQHLDRTRAAHSANRLVNVRLAAAIVGVLEELFSTSSSLGSNQARWLRGAMHYFATSNDDEPDFQSPLGFEDDAEVLNAFLRFIGRNDLCLNSEDYDNA
jgi:uncharacterized membrane protein YkvA (DUF1232 family)